MFRQGQLAVHGLAILLGRNEAGISNREKFFLPHAVHPARIRGAEVESKIRIDRERTKRATDVNIVRSDR